jgi:hypothetical protein
MVLETGQYAIYNVRSMNIVSLPDANRATALITDLDDITPGAKASTLQQGHWYMQALSSAMVVMIQWHLQLLRNSRYTIQNCAFSSYVSCEFGAEENDEVQARETKKDWVIKESHFEDEF